MSREMSSSTQGLLVDSLPGRPPLLSTVEQARRLALLDAIRLKAASPQFLQEEEQSSRLLQLPRELLFAVLAWVPAIQTLACVRSTCSALFVVVEASGALHAALMTHLAAHTRALVAQHTSPPPPLTLVDGTTDAKATARVKVAAQALRAAVEVGARRVPAEILHELQQSFDPQLPRHKCFIAARGEQPARRALRSIRGTMGRGRRGGLCDGAHLGSTPQPEKWPRCR